MSRPEDPPGDADAGSAQTVRFRFRFSPAYRLAGLAFGVGPHTTEARVRGAELTVRFGPWYVTTGLRNVAGVALTGPYAFVKTAGPARLAITDRGLTLATNGDRGVRLRLHHPIPGIEPAGLLRHPELTLTLEDLDGFLALVADRRRRA